MNSSTDRILLSSLRMGLASSILVISAGRSLKSEICNRTKEALNFFENEDEVSRRKRRKARKRKRNQKEKNNREAPMASLILFPQDNSRALQYS